MTRPDVTGTRDLLRPGRDVVRHDLRLVPGALAVWGVTIAGLRGGWPAACGVATVLLGGTLILLRTSRRDAVRMAALAATALAVAAAAVVTIRLGAVHHHPLRAAAVGQERVTVSATVTDLPHQLATPGYGGKAGADRVLVPADLTHATVGGTELDCGGQILLLTDQPGYATLIPGQQVRAEGILVPPNGDPLTIGLLRVRAPPLAVTAAPWWQRIAGTLRTDLRGVSARELSPEPAGLLPGLVDGDVSGQSARVTTEFQLAGLTHLVAVSGENLAILCGAVLLLVRVCRLGPRLSALVTGLAVLGFVVVAGPQPSVLRAAVMGGLTVLALATGRRRAVLPSLAAAVLSLVLLDSALATSLGFALSVLATAALVLIAPGWARTLRRLGVPRGLAEAIAVPTAAHAATAPLIVAASGQLSLVAIPANMLAEPVVAPATVLGVLAMVLAPILPGVAAVVVNLAGPFTSWLITVARKGSELPDAVLPWPDGLCGALLLVTVLCGLAVLLRHRRTRILLAAALVGALLVWLPVRVTAPRWPVTGWAMVSCDVGQGDAEVLATADRGRAVVVDTGPDPLLVDTCLRTLDVDRIPLVVLSHLHADHIGGLSAVLANRTVGAVALGASRVPGWAYEKVRQETAAAHVPLVGLHPGERLAWPGLDLDVLATQPARDEPEITDPDGTTVNNTSVVLAADTVAGRILLTGDVELAAQADLLTGGTELAADVLKVPHHGSRYSVPEFLRAVHPRVALVSVGAGNRYGHPSALTLGELSSLGAAVARTDQDGDLAITPGSGGPTLFRSGRPRAPPHH